MTEKAEVARHITVAPPEGVAERQEVRRLFEDYIDSLPFDMGFQDVAAELADFPGAYAAPEGALLLARVDGEAAGAVALRPLKAAGECEMKRLFLRPAYRGLGLGRRLGEAIVQEARSLGYRRMRLDTVREMAEAIALYRRLGFEECAPYTFNPLPGAMYFALEL